MEKSWDVAFFLSSDSPVSEYYIPTFRNTLFQLYGEEIKLWDYGTVTFNCPNWSCKEINRSIAL